MSERYSRLYSLPENLYASGSPVIISAGALLKDEQTGKVLAQLKLKNIAGKAIKAASVSILPFDTVGNALGAAIEYQYLDLSANRDEEFGAKTPIVLPNAATRIISVTVTEIAFSDNTIWTAESAAWEVLPRSVMLDSVLRDQELIRQYRIEYGADCQYVSKTWRDLWYCSCGAINREQEPVCHRCGKSQSVLQNVDMAKLREKCDERLAAEAKKAAEERAAAEERSRELKRRSSVVIKKLTKIAAIVISVAVLVIAVGCLFKQVIIPNIKYHNAVTLLESGQYDEAIAAFEAMDGYKDSAEQISECKYLSAVALMDAGQYQEAMALFVECKDYKDAKMFIRDILSALIYKPTISTGGYHTAGLKIDGTVMAAGNNDDGQCNVSTWTGIVAVAAGRYHTVGLKTDGTVVAAGYNKYGQCNVSNWTDIVAVAAGFSHTVGLKSDGTVVAVGDNDDGQCNVSDWTDIVAVAAGSFRTVGLKADGTVVAVGDKGNGRCDVSGWRDIVAVAAGFSHTVGLKADGTVVAVGNNNNGRCDVSDWTNMKLPK